MVVPFGPGGTTDIMARLLADEFARQLGGSMVVVNTAGAGGSIGMGNVARAKADGYTLAMTTVGPLTIQPARRDNTGYTPDSFDYVCGTYDVPMLTMVAANSPHKDYAALVAWAKAHPGQLNYGSSGLGTMPHISALQQWKHHAVEVLHVPYKSTGDMVVPLKNGELMMFNAAGRLAAPAARADVAHQPASAWLRGRAQRAGARRGGARLGLGRCSRTQGAAGRGACQARVGLSRRHRHHDLQGPRAGGQQPSRLSQWQ
jgi:hypothetical protein